MENPYIDRKPRLRKTKYISVSALIILIAAGVLYYIDPDMFERLIGMLMFMN